jgi:sigma-B regulation protein RsbU (phosphoserine phosphatase)
MHMPRTLIADDQPDVLAALRLLLKGAGFQTESADSPKAVLEAIKRHEFDVVLMDLNYARDTTSGREGLDLVSRIRAQDNSLPIVVMTAWATVDVAVETMRRGVRDFVEKPWENSRLLQIMRTQVEQGRARRKLKQRTSQRRQLNQTLRRELRDACEIQKGLMPPASLQFTNIEIATAWRPAHVIGGDYLAAFPISDRQIALCAADVSGKGLPAALMMSNLQAALKSVASPAIEPRDVCAQLNRLMCGNIPLNRFISSFYGVLDVQRKSLQFANAGHNAPVLLRNSGELVRLDTGGRVIGAFADSSYLQHEVQLASGDRLFLFTDGITEARNPAGQELEDAALCEIFARESWRHAADLRTAIMNRVSEFCDDRFDDDVALMIVEVK